MDRTCRRPAVGGTPVSGANKSLPPIECPLRKAGIDPTKLKPFEEVEKYIEFLERADRAQWQKPDEVVKALGLKGSEVVVDLEPGQDTSRSDWRRLCRTGVSSPSTANPRWPGTSTGRC